ncbi:MAG: glycosyltransferase family 4 protein [Elusimicrobiota bacterium]
MKLIYIITRLDWGGSSENLIELAEGFYNEGNDIILIYGGSALRNFKFKSYHIPTLRREINLIYDLKTFWKIFNIIKKEKPDIIHTHTSKAGIIGRWTAFFYNLTHFRRIKIIHTPHGHIFYGYFNRLKSYLFLFIEKISSLITDKLIALTENEKKESINFGVAKEDKWLVIPSGISYDIKIANRNLKKELLISEDKIVAGTAGRLEKVKGMEYFVRSLKYLMNILMLNDINKDIVYLIVGDGSELNYLKEISLKDNVSSKIIFTGYRKDVVDLINIMDIYVQSSLNEGMGRAVVIAELLSKPVIASNVCGLKDLVQDGYNGFLVESQNSLQIAIKIYDLIKDEELRIKMGKNSFDFINREEDGFKKYSFERCFYLHKKLYFSISNKSDSL